MQQAPEARGHARPVRCQPTPRHQRDVIEDLVVTGGLFRQTAELVKVALDLKALHARRGEPHNINARGQNGKLAADQLAIHRGPGDMVHKPLANLGFGQFNGLELRACIMPNMPRIAKPVASDVESARAVVRAYLQRSGTTETALAMATDVKQYTVSRLLTGRLKNLNRDAEVLASYARNAMSRMVDTQPAATKEQRLNPSSTGRKELQAAVLEAWDGTEAGAAMLKGVLHALSPLLLRHVKA